MKDKSIKEGSREYERIIANERIISSIVGAVCIGGFVVAIVTLLVKS